MFDIEHLKEQQLDIERLNLGLFDLQHFPVGYLYISSRVIRRYGRPFFGLWDNGMVTLVSVILRARGQTPTLETWPQEWPEPHKIRSE